MDQDSLLRLVYLGLLLMALSGSLIAAFRRAPGHTLQSLLIWAFLALALVAAYALWPEIRRALLPASVTRTATGIEIGAAADGHFYVDATVNGTRLTFLIDTGASDIVLTPADARRIGIDPATLDFSGQASTANGMVATAPIRLDSLGLGPWEDRDLPATVNSGALDRSLLGMSYLSRYKITLSGRTMTLARLP
ncbi:MAG: TIGR02281 family clan AA aspartic protease [Proteobacteria bacterium]|nr:TIGR02281 family clan AA aspartic protease [Pseudomonadota bacterium]MBS0572412.1 TIGR02281 family clan AA aspartic protease [Pseudomonadota bacterium]